MPTPLSFTCRWERIYLSPFGEGDSYRVTLMFPPSGVNLMALESRLRNIWFSLTLSQQTSSTLILSIYTSKLWLLSFTCCWTMATSSCMTFLKETCSMFRVMRPLSIFAMSSMSFISPNKCRLEEVIFPRHLAITSGSPVLLLAMAVMPTMPFKGVRISWLMLERNWLFARLASSAASLASSKSRSCRLVAAMYQANTIISVRSITAQPPKAVDFQLSPRPAMPSFTGP